MFDWRAYLALAHELAQRTDEAALRAAISRAYYAAFGVACDYLGNEKVTTRKLGTHEQRWEVFQDSPSAASPTLRNTLRIRAYDLKRLRHTADYKKSNVISANEAQKALALAQGVIDIIASLPPLQASP
jgi:uncharacterized protein (UPF0332 family)